MAFRLLYRARQQFSHHSIPKRHFRPPPEGKTFDSQKGVLEFLDSHGGGAGGARNGRSWRTSELRLKSYEDLHRLWFILLKERNVLLTEKAWCKTNRHHWENGESNLYKVKRSMARIKGVVGERIRAHRTMEAKRALKDEARGLGLIFGETGLASMSQGSGEVSETHEQGSNTRENTAEEPKATVGDSDDPERKS